MATTRCKRRKVCENGDLISSGILRKIGEVLPRLTLPGYYMIPRLKDLVSRELLDPGYCSRVPEFVVGKFGYGCVKFRGKTDVRWLDLDKIVRFSTHEVIVYANESDKPEPGIGLNKAAEVTLRLHISNLGLRKLQVNDIVRKLRRSMGRQDAEFISFNPACMIWNFKVEHFSRFGLTEEDEEDIGMEDATLIDQATAEMNGEDDKANDKDTDELMSVTSSVPELSHSLPAHLRLDPVKMQEMRMLMFHAEEEENEEGENLKGVPLHQKQSGKEYVRPNLQSPSRSLSNRSYPAVARKTPVPLLEYNSRSLEYSSPGTILMAQQNKSISIKTVKKEGFRFDQKEETPTSGSHSCNIVDAGFFMGRSFRVGWGPNGVLVHSGSPVGSKNSERVLSSMIHVEKVALDKVVRDENNKVKKELVDFCFDVPLNLHKALNHDTEDMDVGCFQLKLQKVVCTSVSLSDICRSYIDIIERQLDVPGLSSSARLVLMHQVVVWELIKVLFSERESTRQLKSVGADNEEDMMQDMQEGPPEVDSEALPLIRRAEFSCWLQESVCHRVQEDVSSLNESRYLEHLFFLLTGRQLDKSVELAVSRGDVRLACLLSQAGGSMVNRSDLEQQLHIWRNNGLDFNFIEKERIKLYELLSGNIHVSLHGINVDWKRFLGLLMWYHLAPDTSLPFVFQKYQELLDNGKAPCPVPIYVDEGPIEEAVDWGAGKYLDISYYLMLLHANKSSEFKLTKTMFSAFSSTYDPLDYHMIWHQRAILEAVGAISSKDLYALDMGVISQLLCQGQCHWAIYVALHMPQHQDYPFLQAVLIREILFQYCECWSSEESQHQCIADLGIPLAWMHEALAVYFNYHGNLPKALEHFVECSNWQKAHSIFVTSVAPTLFLSGDHSEVWRIASSMEGYKSEIENWDLGGGIYISFYVVRSSLHEDTSSMSELDSLDNNNAACRDLLGRLSESSAVWGARLPTDARVAYSKMAEEISELLLSDMNEGSTRDAQLSCFDTVLAAPIPEDMRSNHLQDAVSIFTCYLSEMAA